MEWSTMEMVAGMVGVDMLAGGEVVEEDGVIVVVEEVMVVDICHNSQVAITTMVAEHLLARAVVRLHNHVIITLFPAQ
jgi:hypothetical protein